MNLLEGVKILDFSRLLPGPLASELLAQMGAEVLKIESPKRKDYARVSFNPIDGVSALFHQLNHNKEILILDYESEEGKAKIFDLIRDTDILIEQFRPGAMQAWGLDYASVRSLKPELVYVSITGYGQDNSLAQEAGHDLNYLAYSGILSLLKDEQGKPIVPGTQFADIAGAYQVVMAVQAAFIKKLRKAKGSYVNVSLSDAMLPFLSIPFSLHATGIDHTVANVLDGKTCVNYANYECSDGRWIALGALELKFWNSFCERAEKPNWKRENQLELMNFSFPKSEVETFFKSKSRDEWVTFFKGQEVCLAPILALEELEDFPYHQEKGNFVAFKTPSGKTLKSMRLGFDLE